MREKQLAQEAKKLDAKVGGTRAEAWRERGEQMERRWRAGARRPPRGPEPASQGMERGALGGDSQARLPYTIQDIFGLHLGQELSLW